MDRLKEQTEAHHGGSRWIGTGGTSPVGHSGFHPGGMRVGGRSMGKSAMKVALDRRYRDYSIEGPLTEAQMGEALKRLRRMIPTGPKDRVNVEETIRATTKNAGEIEIVFDRSLRDRLKIILMIDNGGWSMDPVRGCGSNAVQLLAISIQGCENIIFSQYNLRFCLGRSPQGGISRKKLRTSHRGILIRD